MNRIDIPRGVGIDPRVGRAGATPTAPQGKGPAGKVGRTPFGEIFRQELGRGEGLRFSAHAQNRLAARDIRLTPEAVGKLSEAVDRAASKGARDALVLMPGGSRREDLALVISVTNRTVITAMDGDHIQENVFTNIDSAVVVQ